LANGLATIDYAQGQVITITTTIATVQPEEHEDMDEPWCVPVVQRPAITSKIRRYTPSSDRIGTPPTQAEASPTEPSEVVKPNPVHQH
jgi:hypothetical protein